MRVAQGERITLVFQRSPLDPATVTAPEYTFSVLEGPWRSQDDAGTGDDVDDHESPHPVEVGSWVGSVDPCDPGDAYQFDAPAHGRVRVHVGASGFRPEWLLASVQQVEPVWWTGPVDAAVGVPMDLEIAVAPGPVLVHVSAPFGSGPMSATDYEVALSFEPGERVDLAAFPEGNDAYSNGRTSQLVYLEVGVDYTGPGYASLGYCVTEPVLIDADVLGQCQQTRQQTVGPGPYRTVRAPVELERSETSYRTYRVGVLIDSIDTWDELDESNNLAEFQVTVAPTRCHEWLVGGGIC